MDWFPVPKRDLDPKTERREGGVALFMVIAAISVLSIVVVEFSTISQMNQKLAFDGLDQIKAHYLAKTGLKLSLLRLKAYLAIKSYAEGMVKSAGGGAAAKAMVPQTMIDMVWSMPFFYPIPTNIPGLSPADKDKIETFQKSSALEGKFSAIIESESSKFNLNSILAGYVAPAPSASPTTSPSHTPGGPPTTPSPTPNPAPSFNPQAQRDQLKDYLQQLLAAKMEEDPQYNDAYRDPHLMEDLMDNLVAWADFTYTRKTDTGEIPMKKGPFYNVSELHMLPGMDDDLYNLFAPNLTVARTPGINANTMKDVQVKAFFPLITKDELEKFMKDRDGDEADGKFKSEDDVYKYIQTNVQGYNRGNALDELKKQFVANNVHFVTDETEFKITVQSHLNQATRTIEAWVTLGSEKPAANPSGVPSPAATINLSGNGPSSNSAPPDPGIKIHYMRVY